MKEFSLGQFSAHLIQSAALGEVVAHHVVDKAAKIVQADAKARIGMYQDGIGGFTAWANLADSTVTDRISKGFSPDEPLLRTGELRDSIEAKSSGNEAVVGSSDIVALYQECGTSKIPPRPFLGPAGYASQSNIGTMTAETMVAWVGGISWKKPPAITR